MKIFVSKQYKMVLSDHRIKKVIFKLFDNLDNVL